MAEIQLYKKTDSVIQKWTTLRSSFIQQNTADLPATANQLKEGTITLENIFQIKFDLDESERELYWCDGIKLRRLGDGEGKVKMYHKFASIIQQINKSDFRKIKSKKSFERFLSDYKADGESEFELLDFSINEELFNDFSFKFQNSYFIDVDREGARNY